MDDPDSKYYKSFNNQFIKNISTLNSIPIKETDDDEDDAVIVDQNPSKIYKSGKEVKKVGGNMFPKKINVEKSRETEK